MEEGEVGHGASGWLHVFFSVPDGWQEGRQAEGGEGLWVLGGREERMWRPGLLKLVFL